MHVDQGAEPGERGFGSLVVVRTVFEQAIATAARGGVGEGEADGVVAEEPVEGIPRLVDPLRVAGRMEGFDAGGDRGMRLDGLLVESGGGPSPAEESAAPHRSEASARRCLQRGQPAEHGEAGVESGPVAGPAAARNECLAEPGVVVRDDIFRPVPVGRGIAAMLVEQAARELRADDRDPPIAIEPSEVFLDPKDAERPCPRARGAEQGVECWREKPHSPGSQSSVPATADAGTQRLERTAQTVVRASAVEPAAIEREKVAKAARLRHEGMSEKHRVVRGGPSRSGRTEAKVVESH